MRCSPISEMVKQIGKNRIIEIGMSKSKDRMSILEIALYAQFLVFCEYVASSVSVEESVLVALSVAVAAYYFESELHVTFEI